MLIDWFTVGAQALNFLILVWLLKRFLYKPILDAVDARERRIAAELADAEAKKAQAREERDEFQRKNEEFAQQRAALLNRVAEESKEERQRLLDEARHAADALTAQRRQALSNEARDLEREIRRRTRAEVFAIARKALHDLTGTELEARMVEVFANRLRALDSKDKERVAKALNSLGNESGTSEDVALVRSAFSLPVQQQAAVRAALEQAFSREISLRFETRVELIGGIELSAGGQKLAWSIDDYLATMEKHVGELLNEERATESGPDPVSGMRQPEKDAN